MTPKIWGSICYWLAVHAAAPRHYTVDDPSRALALILIAAVSAPKTVAESVRGLRDAIEELPVPDPHETIRQWAHRVGIPDGALSDRVVGYLATLRYESHQRNLQ